MKLIIAYIQPERLPDVKQALQDSDITHMSVTNALGAGSQMGFSETYRGAKVEINLLKKVRLEIAVNDEFEDKAVDAIVKGAHTDSIGDGKIFVISLERVVRIRTGEEGGEAIGGRDAKGDG